MKFGVLGAVASGATARDILSACVATVTLLLAVTWLSLPNSARAESICAEVKIQISQKVSMERQAFEAVLKVRNGLEGISVENLNIFLEFKDAQGNIVGATENQTLDDPAYKFFYREDFSVGIEGDSVAPTTTGERHWLIIPTSYSAGATGTGYLVGARITYKIGDEVKVADVIPETITV